MSYPSNNRSYNCNPSMNNYNNYGSSPYNNYYNNNTNNNNGYGRNPQMNQMQLTSYNNNYPSSGMMQMQPQPHQRPPQQMGQQPQQQMDHNNDNGCGPRVSILSPDQPLDPNMKVIKLNWGDLLGGSGNGGHGLQVAMVGANGDISGGGGGAPGLRCTLNGQVPQNTIVHTMSINPYQNVSLGAKNNNNNNNGGCGRR